MQDDFFTLPRELKSEIITSAAYQLDLSPIVVEKDIWVCWVLDHLFSMELPVPISFKGGTSLSKCYQLINRFSEDLDITLDYRNLKKLDKPIGHYSRSFLKNVSKELKILVKGCVHEIILPNFKSITKDFPDLIETEVSPTGEELRLHYPSVFEQENRYLINSVLIEFGGRNVTEPNEIHKVKPYLANYAERLKLPIATVNVLSPLRTFWEKVTLIHVECHRGRLISHQGRLSRHWYDLAMLAESAIAPRALSDFQLMVDVIKHKEAFFNASYANYDKCLNKQFQLIPCGEDLKSLKKDFDAMIRSNMFFYKKSPDFIEIINILKHLEQKLNK